MCVRERERERGEREREERERERERERALAYACACVCCDGWVGVGCLNESGLLHPCTLSSASRAEVWLHLDSISHDAFVWIRIGRKLSGPWLR